MRGCLRSGASALRRTQTGLRCAARCPPGEYTLAETSAPVHQRLLFALPLLSGASVIRITPPFESRSYVDLTLRALADFGVRAAFTDENTIAVPGGQTYLPCAYTVEGDYSQAAFLAVLGAARGGVAVTGPAGGFFAGRPGHTGYPGALRRAHHPDGRRGAV